MTRHGRWVLLALPVLVACGSSTPSSPSGAQRTLIAQGAFGVLPSSDNGNTNTIAATFLVAFSAPEAGTLDAVVDWASTSDHMAVALYPGGCTAAQLGFGGCNPLVQGDSASKPARVTLNGAAAGAYALAILNLGPGSESGTYQVGLSR